MDEIEQTCEHESRCLAPDWCVYPDKDEGACRECEYNHCQCDDCVKARTSEDTTWTR